MRRAVVIGSGPNGLAAAVTLAEAGVEVEVVEAHEEIGGGTRTAELTLPGFRHDVCSAIHPLARASPVFRGLGLDWIEPPAACVHPFDDGTAVTLERRIHDTASQLGADADGYRRLVTPFARAAERFAAGRVPVVANPLPALASARALAESRFGGEPARGFFAGHAAHSMLPLERQPSAGFALSLLALGHAVGWPFPRGGSSAIAEALARKLGDLGGTIRTSAPADELPRADLVLCDVVPRELVRLARGRLPASYERRLVAYRHGPGAFKLDWALSGPIPWAADGCRRAATVHLGATFEEICRSERKNRSERPFVLLAQQSLFDPSRAPAGRHTAWAYCHVPNASGEDRTEAIEGQVERFAPGFRELVLARSIRSPADLQAENRNYVGGDINGGIMDLGQLLRRPTLVPYRTPLSGVYLCSSATPPGGGVHGLCGAAAAGLALRSLR
jgi:phytoene dehydrogenase-like protein